MKPEPTMSAQEEAMWEATHTFLQGRSKLIDKQQAVRRSRLWALYDLRKRSQGYGTPSQRTVILAFLDWLEAKGDPA